MGLDNIIFGQVDKGKQAIKNVYAQATNNSEGGVFSAPGRLVTSTVSESVKLVGSNVNDVMKWTVSKMTKALGGTVKLGLNGLMLVPLPLPGGYRNLAGVRGDVRTGQEVLDIKLRGDPAKAGDIFRRLRQTRTDAQASSGPPPQPTPAT